MTPSPFYIGARVYHVMDNWDEGNGSLPPGFVLRIDYNLGVVQVDWSAQARPSPQWHHFSNLHLAETGLDLMLELL